MEGVCGMARSSLFTLLVIVAGAIIGFFAGAVLGVVMGSVLDFLMQEGWYKWRSLYGGMIGSVAGLIVGMAAGVLGVRTRFGIEWPLIFGAGTLVGFWIQSERMLADVVLLTGIGALAGWLVALLMRLLFRKWLPQGPFEKKMIASYLLLFGLVAFFVPFIMQFLAMLFSF